MSDAALLSFEHVSKDYAPPPPMRMRRFFSRFGGLHVEDGFSPEALGGDELDDDDDMLLEGEAEDDVPVAYDLDTHRVVDDVTLDLHEGTLVALTGAEGTGKTTVLKLAAGIVDPTEGQVIVRGSVAPALLAMSLVLPNRGHTVKVALPALAAMVGIAPNDVRERLDAIAELMGTPQILNSSTSLIESRVKRQLILAMALVLAPDILLLDIVPPRDPFGERCVEHISALREAGTLVVIELRDPRYLRKIGLTPDRVTTLRTGRVLEDTPSGTA